LPRGRYGYPKFSPKDVNTIVYQRLAADLLSGDLDSSQPGIYLATLSQIGGASSAVLH